MVIKQQYGVNGTAIAASLMVVAILDKLIAEKILTANDVRELLTNAKNAVSPDFSRMLGEQQAAAMITDVLKRFE